MSALGAARELEVLVGTHAPGPLGERLLAVPLAGRWRPWLLAAGLALSLAMALLGAIGWTLAVGVGSWGVQVPVAWGLAIVNFVWWIGIGHAGTLISAILLLCRQGWRTSINRFAEAMTLFAVAMAALFPLLHLGRPDRFYWLVPYPATMEVWPQWRSPLVWDFFAISTYGTVSLLFWWLGLVPDLAALRDRARRPIVRRLAGLLALGWRGASRQWARLEALYLLLAGLATPLVVSVHSIVSLDFARTIVPGWHVMLFPPYFVAGAIFSGLAMVVTIAVPLRRLCALEDLITARHLDCLGKLMLASGLVVAWGYGMEGFDAWFSGDPHALAHEVHRLGSTSYRVTLLLNVLALQLLWIPAARRRAVPLFLVSQGVNVGMWLERWVIVVGGLEQGYVPAEWAAYRPSPVDWALLLGTLGTFALLLLLFFRLLPGLSIHELRHLAHAQGRARLEPAPPRGEVPLLAAGGRAGTLAEFAEPERLVAAARAAREAGLRRLEAWTPWPVEGLEEALGRPPTRLPLAVLAGALAGGGLGWALQWGTILDFPWNVGGRPLNEWPAFVPVVFELTVLGGALAGVLGFLLANRLPRLHHPDFDLPGFEGTTRDRFLLLLDGRDPGWERARARELVLGAGPLRVSELGVA